MNPDYHSTLLHDGEILLRTIRPSDAQQLYNAVMLSFPELNSWMPWCHDHYSLADAQNWCSVQQHMWDDAVEYGFAICDKTSGAYFGGCSINRIDVDFKTANIGYWTRSDWTGQGIATRAIGLLARWAFTELGLNRVEIICAEGNLPSCRIAEKAGAKKEAVLRNRLEYRSVVQDALLYSLIPKDLE
jgi:ribosomal-protein-serine acetyltransferase